MTAVSLGALPPLPGDGAAANGGSSGTGRGRWGFSTVLTQQALLCAHLHKHAHTQIYHFLFFLQTLITNVTQSYIEVTGHGPSTQHAPLQRMVINRGASS